MKLNRIEKSILFISGASATIIGGLILLIPHSFYASSGISLGNDASLLSELKAPAAGLFMLGIFMLLGITRAAWAHISMFSALVVYLAFPAGRLISIAFDGMPSAAILIALGFELLIAALCLVAFMHRFIASVQNNIKPQTQTA